MIRGSEPTLEVNERHCRLQRHAHEAERHQAANDRESDIDDPTQWAERQLTCQAYSDLEAAVSVFEPSP
jgi:hypothetical protein